MATNIVYLKKICAIYLADAKSTKGPSRSVWTQHKFARFWIWNKFDKIYHCYDSAIEKKPFDLII